MSSIRGGFEFMIRKVFLLFPELTSTTGVYYTNWETKKFQENTYFSES